MTVEEGQFFSPLPGTIDDFMYNFESFLVEPAVGLHLWCQLDRVNKLMFITWPFKVVSVFGPNNQKQLS